MSSNVSREKQITKTSFIGIAVNVFLAGFKALVGFMSGAVSVILDAVNNLTDAISSVVTVIGIKLAKKKPNAKHPFGYGRTEYFSAIIVAALVLTAGITAITESAKKIFSSEIPDYSAVTLIVIGVAVVAKILLGTFFKKQGAKYNSDALVASGADASFDAIISATTLIGGAITMAFGFSVDGIVGVLISLFIIKAGIEMLLSAISNVMGNRPDAEVSVGIKDAIKEINGVRGVYDLVLHNYGPESAIGSVHIEVDAKLIAEEIYAIVREIQLSVAQKFHLFITVGIYPFNEKYADLRDKVDKIALSHEGVIQTHGFYIDEKNKVFSIDVVTDFTVKDKDKLRDLLKNELNDVLNGFTVNVNFDVNYSD